MSGPDLTVTLISDTVDSCSLRKAANSRLKILPWDWLIMPG